jgi:hypothetical protein
VYEIIEQNQTKTNDLNASLSKLMKENNLQYKQILSTMHDNAENNFGKSIKIHNKSIYDTSCTCHNLNLILQHHLEFMFDSELSEELQILDIREFCNSLVSYLHYSYKRNEDYVNFREQYLKEKQKEGLYPNKKTFLTFKRYVDTRWLSLGNSMQAFLPQWACFFHFLEDQLHRKKELKLTKKNIINLHDMTRDLEDESLKFFFLFLDLVIESISDVNKLFQREACQLQEIFTQSWSLLTKFIKLIFEDKNIQNIVSSNSSDKLKATIENSKMISDKLFTKNLINLIDFDQSYQEFIVDIEQINSGLCLFAKKSIKNLCLLIIQYLPMNDMIVKAFKLLDPRNRTIPESITMFRDHMLKNFMLCYGSADFKQILKQFQVFSETKDDSMPFNIQIFVNKDGTYDVEGFWLRMNSEMNENFIHLSLFFTKIMMVPHSNAFVERMFSHVNNIKNDARNRLDVTSVSNILKVKSYYQNSESELFEPTEEHYESYQNFIKAEKI